mgnify:CR=1 FL=1
MKKIFVISCLFFLFSTHNSFSQQMDPNGEESLKMLCEEKNVSISCWKLGDRYRTLDRDLKKALIYYEKACEMGLMNGCSYAGVVLAQRGTPYSKDFKKATKYFVLACDQKHDLACFNLGSIKYKEGRAKKAIKYYDLACELGHKGACARAAKLKK